MHKFSTKLPTRVVTWIHNIAASSQSPQQTLTCKVVWLITGYLQSTEHYRVLSCIPATCIIRHVLRFQNRFLGRILHGNWYIHSWKVSVLDQSPGPENPVEGSDQMWHLFFKLSSAGAVKRLELLERASTSEATIFLFLKKYNGLACGKVMTALRRAAGTVLLTVIGYGQGLSGGSTSRCPSLSDSRTRNLLYLWLWLLWGVCAWEWVEVRPEPIIFNIR